MALIKKPLHNKSNEGLIDSIINKGGSSPSFDTNKNRSIKITIRLPHDMLSMIDVYLKRSISKKTRTCWIREAVAEKIEKDIEQI